MINISLSNNWLTISKCYIYGKCILAQSFSYILHEPTKKRYFDHITLLTAQPQSASYSLKL